MFGLIRILVWCAILFIVFKNNILNNRVYINHKVKKVVTIIVCILLLIISFIIPVENAFITFSTPESVFRYYNNGKLELVVDGESTSLIVADDSTILIIPKADNEWKLGMGYETKTVYHSVDNGFWISLLRYKETDEYYIVVSGISGKINKIEDNKNSIFSFREDQSTCYAYIDDYNEDYCLTINEINQFIINNQTNY